MLRRRCLLSRCRCCLGLACGAMHAWWRLLLLVHVAAATDLALDTFNEGQLSGPGRIDFYRVWLEPSTPSVKVVLLPLSGDADVLVSFDSNATSSEATTAPTWSMTASGLEELLIRREHFCHLEISENAGLASAAARSSWGGGGDGGGGERSGCYLYLRVRAFYETEFATYKVGVLHANDPFGSTSECALGCTPALLTNSRCDVACNVTACAFDWGKCVPQLASACSPGCDADWLDDGFCDDACFTAACDWDLTDCHEIDIEGCADKW